MSQRALVRLEQSVMTVAQQTVQQIYRKGVKFSKAGVILLDIRPEAVIQGALPFDEDDTVPNAQAASVALDAITARFGKSALVCSATLKGSGNWQMRQTRRSPNYTTKLSDVPVVRA